LRYRAWYLGGVACLVLTNWLAVRIPLELGRATDALESGDLPLAREAAAIIAAMGLAVILVRTLSRALIFTPGRNIENDLRNDIMAHVLRLRRDVISQHGAGDLVSRASNDISLVRALIGYGTLQVFNISSAMVLAGREMLELSPLLTGITLAPVALATLASSGAIRTIFPLTRAAQRQLASLSNYVLSSFQGIATVQAFAAEPAFQRRLDEHNRSYMQTILRVATLAAAVQPVLAGSAAVALYLLLVVGGKLTVQGSLSIGQLVALSAYLLYLLPHLRSLGWMVAIVQRGRASLERIFEVLDLPVTDAGATRSAPTLAPGPLGFQLAGLTVPRPDQEEGSILDRVEARFEPGSMVGIFGRTGSGKTTLLEVLARLREVPRGQVVLLDAEGGACPLSDYPLQRLRQRVSVVPQVPFLFTSTISRNISMDRQANTARAPAAATEAALSADLASLPEGLETVVGERGVTLSGGQRQRVALARGFCRDFDLLLLDDVLSAVDHATEQQLVTSIRQRAAGGNGARPTIIVVSHRLGVLAHADKILVLHEGALVDQGRHDELIARAGPYREAWLAQLGQEAPPQPPSHHGQAG